MAKRVWTIIDGPKPYGGEKGFDGDAWLWTLSPVDGPGTVTVVTAVTRSAIQSDLVSLPGDVADAIQTKGKFLIQWRLHEKTLPRTIVIDSDGNITERDTLT